MAYVLTGDKKIVPVVRYQDLVNGHYNKFLGGTDDDGYKAICLKSYINGYYGIIQDDMSISYLMGLFDGNIYGSLNEKTILRLKKSSIQYGFDDIPSLIYTGIKYRETYGMWWGW
jgi:hypothetical protein